MKRLKKIVLLILICVLPHFSKAGSPDPAFLFVDTPITGDTIPPADSAGDRTTASKVQHKKLIAAVLSFPLPFGIIGLHRIYLGTKPYMPFAYIGTVGGCLGILPMLDFIAILTTSKEKLSGYENNPKVFMWAH